MDAKLIVVGGEAEKRQYDLHLPATIGRSRSTDIRLGHRLVSRQHCQVFESDGLLMVRDLGSLNGTFVGDKRVAEAAAPVKPGELLTIGPVTLRAVYESSQPADGSWAGDGRTNDAPLPSQVDDSQAGDS